MWILILNLVYTIHLFALLCCGARFIDLPAFDGEVPARPPSANRRSAGKSKEDTITDEEQKLSEIDIPYSNDTITVDMLGYKGDLPDKSSDEDINIETFNNFMSDDSDSDWESDEVITTSSAYPPVRRRMNRRIGYEIESHVTKTPETRRHWLVSEATSTTESSVQYTAADEKDSGLKTKILTLVQQTMHDTDTKVRSIQWIKEKYRDRAPYRIGFILSMVKKSRDVLNELFNVAVKHREEWKALEQLKIFELIVHTNVDTTNLVRQLVELHINNLNATQKKSRLRVGQTTKHRVVIL